MDDRDEPLAPRLKALLVAEKGTRDTIEDARRTAISEKLDRAIAAGHAPVPQTSPSSPFVRRWAGPARTISLLALGATTGALGHARWGAHESAGTPAAPIVVAATPPAFAPADSSAPVASVTPVAPPPSVADVSPRRSVPFATTPSTRIEDAGPSNAAANSLVVVDTPEASALAEERALVERGRAAIARRDGVSAGDALRLHASRFPNGQLVEERDALVVQALVLAGHPDDARRKASEFEAHFPSSLFLPRVKETIRTAP